MSQLPFLPSPEKMGKRVKSVLKTFHLFDPAYFKSWVSQKYLKIILTFLTVNGLLLLGSLFQLDFGFGFSFLVWLFLAFSGLFVILLIKERWLIVRSFLNLKKDRWRQKLGVKKAYWQKRNKVLAEGLGLGNLYWLAGSLGLFLIFFEVLGYFLMRFILNRRVLAWLAWGAMIGDVFWFSLDNYLLALLIIGIWILLVRDWDWGGRTSLGLGFFFLSLPPLILSFGGQEATAEKAALWSFYLFAIGVIKLFNQFRMVIRKNQLNGKKLFKKAIV